MAGLNTDLVVVHVPLSGALTANETSLSYPIPFAAQVVSATVHVGTAPTGADLKVDVRVNGTAAKTVTVTAGQTSGSVATTSGPAAGDKNVVTTANQTSGTDYIGAKYPDPTPVATLAAGDLLSVKVTQVGSTVAGSDAVVAVVLDRK